MRDSKINNFYIIIKFLLFMKIISWNINGINSVINKGLIKFMEDTSADIYCFQETKCSNEKIKNFDNHLDKYINYWACAEKKGYSGLLISTKIKPLSIFYGINNKDFDNEGRVITLEFNSFYLINTYFPNSNHELSRLDFKLKFNNEFLEYCNKLKEKKPLIICGDFNVAHTEIDLKNPKTNVNNAGFTIQERDWFTKFLDSNYIDTFRIFNKESGNYTWWSYRFNARSRNIGWRIDYFIVNKEIKIKIIKSLILKDILGSDHCPILLEVNI